MLALGETREMSSEANARSDLDLPGMQEELLEAVAATGKPVVVVLFNGRPLALPRVAASADAILEAWYPGTEAGNAAADVLYGVVNPGGKLPVTFPRKVGTVPLYYNHEPTGRPCSPTFKWNSRYRDLATCKPLYEFGFGLSYTSFDVAAPTLDKTSVPADGAVQVYDQRDQHRHRQGRRGRADVHPRPGREHLAAGEAAARLPAGDAGRR